MFFDVEGIEDALAGAHLYVSGISNGKGQELIYFDIPLELYLEHALASAVSGKVGVLSKADSFVYFDDFRVRPKG